jgi:hypothetical protein
MLQVSERAADELARLLSQSMPGVRQAMRLGLKPSGGLAMTIDVPHPGDTLVRRHETVLLIVEGRLSPHLTDRGLDVPPGQVGARREFTLRTKATGPTSAVPSVHA